MTQQSVVEEIEWHLVADEDDWFSLLGFDTDVPEDASFPFLATWYGNDIIICPKEAAEMLLPNRGYTVGYADNWDD